MCTDAIRFADADGALLPGCAGKQSQGEIPHLDPPVKDMPSDRGCSDEDTTAANHPFMSGTFGVRLTREVAHANIMVHLFSFEKSSYCYLNYC